MIDAQQSLTDFNRMIFGPSAAAWGLQPNDLDSFAERYYHTVGSTQWQAAMFPEGFNLGFMSERLSWYVDLLFFREFSLLTFVAAIFGVWAIRRRNRPISNMLLVAFFTVIVIILNYDPGDKHLFYLPSYIPLTVAASAGFAMFLGWAESRFRPNIVNILVPILLILLIGQHFWGNRLQAIVDGKATFVTETYPYPVEDLSEPRRVATEFANQMPDNTLGLISWRALYTTLYVTHIEQGKTNIGIIEPTPFGTNGHVTESLVAVITEALAEGRPVLADATYDLSRHFRVQRTGDGMYQVTLRE
jgi:hypothetical protein